ncbi:carbon-nitrogen hydrolase family protein [Propylenella binzhouense]|uniref:Carbon-nitrogen hydrolase family protein n=1 Tax=Propylenella binzhouense TaxID=2555902 RepID=A0A964T7Y5_9HYPH|nr:carbon-nitrogen hydrolase family protein [Propylenella binzhouense]MYZ49532.1 carbon-nitrogen hydrolase family protein [Propylenella binzhouense]
MTKTFRAACIQLRSSGDVAENIAIVEALAREAASRGADYVQTPEMTNIVQRDRRALEAAIRREAEDPSLAAFSALARELAVYVHIGSLALRTEDGRIANRAYLFGPDGRVRARYDKIHLFDVDLPNGESWRESAVYNAGGEAVVADLPWCRLGVAICYDIRFPQLFRAEAHAGATVLTAPAAFTRQTGEAHWNILQRARAIENGAFVISAAQAGRHQDGRETYGHSIVVSPWGEVLAEGSGDGPELVMAEIDPAKSAEARQRIPALRNERPFAVPAEPVQPLEAAS